MNYGVGAGYLYNWLSVEQYNSTGRNGFKVGGVVELSLNNNLTFDSGISYVRKGGETQGESMFGSTISKIKFSQMDYLQIPLTVGYKIKLTEKLSVKPQIGVYYAVGVGGDSFITAIDGYNQPYESRISTFSGDSSKPYRPCNRSDFGSTLGLGITYEHIGLKVSYEEAITNATYYGDGKHRTLAITAIYWIK